MDDNKRAGENEELTIDLYEILYLFRQKIVFIIIALLVGAIAAGLVTKFLITPKYSATSKIYIVSSSSSSVVNLSDLQIGTNLAPDYRELMTARPLLLTVISNLNLPYTPGQLKSMLTVANTSGTRILTVTATGPDPQEAMAIANELARDAVEWLPEIMNSNAPSVYEDAIVPSSPSSPNMIMNIMIGALAVALLYCAFEVIRYLHDDTITSSEQMERLFGTMPLATIPEEKGINSDD